MTERKVVYHAYRGGKKMRETWALSSAIEAEEWSYQRCLNQGYYTRVLCWDVDPERYNAPLGAVRTMLPGYCGSAGTQ